MRRQEGYWSIDECRWVALRDTTRRTEDTPAGTATAPPAPRTAPEAETEPGPLTGTA